MNNVSISYAWQLATKKKTAGIFVFQKNSLFQNLLLLRYTFTISILENKNEQKIVKIEILRTTYVLYVVNAIILTCNFFMPQHFSAQKMTNFFVKLNQFYLISRQADLEDPN